VNVAHAAHDTSTAEGDRTSTAEGERTQLPGEMMVSHHGMVRWVDLALLGFGAWLVLSPVTVGYDRLSVTVSDIASGLAIAAFAALSRWGQRAWAPYAAAVVGTWLLFAPIALWAKEPGAYLNDTIVGAVVVALAVLIPHGMEMDGGDVPPGWSYNPSTWGQRAPIIGLAMVGFAVSRYMAAFQLEHISSVADPIFGRGTERILTSDISEMFPVSDAGLGASIYLFEVLMMAMGDKRRWRTMPWMVGFFALLVVPMGVTSIVLVILQPVSVGTWCTACLVAAVAMLVMVPLSLDEVVAMVQLVVRRRREGVGAWRTFWYGANQDDHPAVAEGPAVRTALRGMTVPPSLVASTAIGIWLMAAPDVLGIDGGTADSDRFVGALVVTFAMIALAEVARSVRLLTVPLAAWLLVAPWLLDGSMASAVSDLVSGLLLLALSLPRGAIVERAGGWEQRVR